MAKNPAAAPEAAAEKMVEAANGFVSTAIDNVAKTLAAQPAAAKEGMDALNAAASAAKSRFAELQMKGVEIAEVNTKAAFAFVRDAMAVKSPETLVTLQQDFFKAQQDVLMRQFQDVNSLTLAILRDLSAPLQDGLNKSIASFTPAFSGMKSDKAAA